VRLGASVQRVGAGSVGYIATGDMAVWISSDGASWKSVPLSAAAFKGVTLIENGTAFSGGYVLGGATLAPEGGCGGPPHILPSVWWSADGRTWSRDQVPSIQAPTATGSNAYMTVCRISDKALLATETSYDAKTDKMAISHWTSTDGRTWKLVSSKVPDCSNVLTDGPRGVIFNPASLNTDSTALPTEAYDVRADLTMVALGQTGDVPDAQAWANGDLGIGSVALGPTGVVVATYDGTGFWVGVPVGG
jgi:hypothetical protein